MEQRDCACGAVIKRVSGRRGPLPERCPKCKRQYYNERQRAKRAAEGRSAKNFSHLGPDQRSAAASHAAKARWAGHVPTPPAPKAPTPSGPCPYCGDEMYLPHRVQCGKPECERLWRNDRCKEWQRNNRAKANSYRPRYTRTCVECGGTFETGNKHAKYCSVGAGSCEAQGRAKANVVHGRRRRAAAEERRRARIVESFTDEVTSRRDELAYLRMVKSDPCSYCGGEANALDHVVPKSEGGDDGWGNRTATCRECNSAKGTLPLLVALTWIPASREYHAKRRALFAA